jgi:hypothetical protein
MHTVRECYFLGRKLGSKDCETAFLLKPLVIIAWRCKNCISIMLVRPRQRKEHPRHVLFILLPLRAVLLRGSVVEMISELLDPLNAGGRLSSYIDLLKRLGCPASDPDRLCCLQATSWLPGGAYICLQWWG